MNGCNHLRNGFGHPKSYFVTKSVHTWKVSAVERVHRLQVLLYIKYCDVLKCLLTGPDFLADVTVKSGQNNKS